MQYFVLICKRMKSKIYSDGLSAFLMQFIYWIVQTKFKQLIVECGIKSNHKTETYHINLFAVI